MLGFDNYEEEYLFHRKLALAILYLAPVVVFVLMGFRPPTYGKHVTVGKTKQPTVHAGENQTSASSASSDDVSNSDSSNAPTSSLRKRRGSSKTESTSKNTKGVTTRADADKVDDKSYGTFSDDGGGQKQQKEEKHWLGPRFPARWSWVFFESPCWIWVLICLWDFYHNEEGEESKILPIRNRILLGWFSFHYLYRSLWYPLVMMKTTSARIPFGIIFLAWSYCTVNGYLQARDLTKFNIPVFVADEKSLLTDQQEYQFWFGVLLIVIGFCINFTSDRILQRIKQEKQRKLESRQNRQSNKQGEASSNGGGGSGTSRYSVPYGGFFEYVSSPHYFGELMEWTGFCIASNFSLASISFVVWTAANLIPRAIHTHKWYNETFVGRSGKRQEDGDDDDDGDSVDYSKLDRKAILPFIL